MSNSPTRVVTPTFTASFPNLFEPSGFEGTEPKYSVTMLFDKDVELDELKAACLAAIEKKWPEASSRPKNITMPMLDGDEKLDSNGDPRPEFANKKYAVTKAKMSHPPKVVDQSLQPILDANDIYGGVQLRASVTAFGWSFGGKHGVSLGLNHIQKMGDGDKFGGSVSVEDEFGAAF
tara:strand:+ start:6042 stop:6572 length:531 start_codon:yes stop_codon:yes gene_type:complete